MGRAFRRAQQLDRCSTRAAALGSMVVTGVITLSIERDWLGTRWHLGALLLPTGLPEFAAHPTGHQVGSRCGRARSRRSDRLSMSSLVVTGVAAAGRARRRAGSPRRRAVVRLRRACNGLASSRFYSALARGPVLLVSPLVRPIRW
jgi:hypothetical protein